MGALVFAAAALVSLGSAHGAASPFGVGLPEQGGAGWLPWIAAWQREFYRELTGALKGLHGDGRTFWWLAGLSFTYGIVHAAGPGHGKVVISSYLLATGQSAKRGIAIALLAALAQAGVAILIVAIMAAALRMTSFAITDTARLLEVGSYGLIAALGIAILVRKGREALAMLAPAGGRGTAAVSGHHAGHHRHAGGGHDHAHGHDHDHGHAHDGCGCGHSHVPTPDMAARVHGIRGAAAAILSVGVRPCTGALIVLVFALAQGIFWAGIASTVLMAFGTALAVAALAAFAVGAKSAALKVLGAETRLGSLVVLGGETAAAVAITAFGLLLLAGALYG
ncbi:nickel/cobalt transporter [Propylenella binzhouense]|uniref:nickel/cobalt transporter n=1 Tax=Propylenella binzhouense TaxID=2555902 RepID=UPI0019670CD6|nr:nickel transporter [Propylenella binzhouense]